MSIDNNYVLHDNSLQRVTNKNDTVLLFIIMVYGNIITTSYILCIIVIHGSFRTSFGNQSAT